MSENSIFSQFLKHFTHEFANGDVIRKYADRSCSIDEIRQHLDFPTPREEIYKMAWTHLLATKQILLEKPDHEEFGRYEYVKDVSPFGKVSYRKVKIPSDIKGNTFQEQPCTLTILDDYHANPTQIIYVQIPFGILRCKDKKAYQTLLNALDISDASYIDSMFVERKYVYYKLNDKMERILRTLLSQNLYKGSCYVQEKATCPL